jgi:acyl dehydratase
MSELTVTPARHGPFPDRLRPDAIAAYAAATGDETPAVLDGLTVPAVFPVILVFEAQEAARADLPAAAWERARGGVHGEQDIVLHRPLLPGEPLDTWSQISTVRTSRAGTHLVVHLQQSDAEGRIAVEQWWTMVLLGLTGVADLGSTPAEHRFPEDARAHPRGWTSQHLDSRVARVAVRFASPTPLGEALTVNAYGIDQNSYAFEATSRGVATITHGRLELRP